MQRIQGHVGLSGLSLEPRELRRFVGRNEPLGDEHENLGRGAWRETFEERSQTGDRIARLLPRVGGNLLRLGLHLAVANHDLRVASTPLPRRRREAALPLIDSLDRDRIFPLERQCVGNAHVSDPDDDWRIAVDLLEEPLDEPMIRSEVHLGATRDARERDAVGWVEPLTNLLAASITLLLRPAVMLPRSTTIMISRPPEVVSALEL